MSTPQMDLRLLGRLGRRRAKSKADSDQALVEIVEHLTAVQDAGGSVNVSLAAERSGVPRQTLLRALDRTVY